jgi:hypothetical protein
MPSSLSSISVSQYFFSFQDFFEVQLRREIGRDLIVECVAFGQHFAGADQFLTAQSLPH